ncbi:MAG: hypothetical protein EPN17_14050 [Methylobacter sp.]|nr:MAG: hypothetical protein EPN17_14050 [Methylobacter sp.]
MAISIKSIFAVTLLTFTMTATAGTVTVHNQAHYLVGFKVWGLGQDSGVFPIGQSRTMENISGTLELNWLPGFGWRQFENAAQIKADGTMEVTFFGDIFNPTVKINDQIFNLNHIWR